MPSLAATVPPESPLMIAVVVFIGLAAGLIGGLVGVGGSVIIIPALTFVLGPHQHLYQATAMIANVAVSIPATRRHARAGALVRPALFWMLPAALVFVLAGVWLSNRPFFAGSERGTYLGRILGVVLFYEVFINILRLLGKGELHRDLAEARVTRPRSLMVGSAMGSIGGLLGIGGGALAVPLQQIVLRLPLRNAIANSSAIICLSATLGALYKNGSLAQHGYNLQQSLTLALMLVPTCWLGGHLGATLTHRLPLRQVRIVFVILMAVAAYKMLAIRW